MSFKYLVNEGYRLRRNFSVPSALVVLRKKTEKAVSIGGLSLSVQLLPVAAGSCGKRHAFRGSFVLLPLLRLFLKDEPIAEQNSSPIGPPCLFQQRPPLLWQVR